MSKWSALRDGTALGRPTLCTARQCNSITSLTGAAKIIIVLAAEAVQ